MKIGATDLSGSNNSTFKKTNYFDVESNVQNLFRVFPPLFSLADKGQLTYFHKVHSVWLTAPKSGKQYPQFFKCIERKKDKVITQACPFCELNVKNKAIHKQGADMLKNMLESESKNMQQKTLNDFFKYKVMSTGADSKNYLNVMKADGKIGVLKISYKQYEALKARLADLQKNFNTDATGMTGIFLNFTKASPYKGSIDVTFSVDAHMEMVAGQNGMPQMSFKYHQIDEALIAKMEKECEDLALLYSDQELTYDQIKALADVFDDKVQLAQVAQTVFKKATTETVAPAPVAASTVIAPAPQAVVTAPQAFAPAPVTAPAPQAFAPAPQVVAPATIATVVASAGGIFGNAPMPQGGLSNVSEDEFAKLFG